MGKEKDERLEKIRHSAAHVMADAVRKLYPGVKLAIGPAIEDGFYYDFDFSGCEWGSEEVDSGHFITPEDLPKIEKEMIRIIEKDQIFEKKVISKTCSAVSVTVLLKIVVIITHGLSY